MCKVCQSVIKYKFFFLFEYYEYKVEGKVMSGIRESLFCLFVYIFLREGHSVSIIYFVLVCVCFCFLMGLLVFCFV